MSEDVNEMRPWRGMCFLSRYFGEGVPLMTLLRCSVDSARDTARTRRGLDISVIFLFVM